MQLSCQFPIPPIRRNKRRNRHCTTIREEEGHFGDAADILGAVGGGEAEVGVEAEADVVAVEAVGVQVVRGGEEGGFEGGGDGGFSRGGEAG